MTSDKFKNLALVVVVVSLVMCSQTPHSSHHAKGFRATMKEENEDERWARAEKYPDALGKLMRHGDRMKLYNMPDIRKLWDDQQNDRFASTEVLRSVELTNLNKGGFRRTPLQRIRDTRTGDELQISGDPVDNNWGGTIKIGEAKYDFGFHISLSPGGSRWQIDQPIPPNQMIAIANLINSPSIDFYSKYRPIVPYRKKLVYFGRDGERLMSERRDAFLDPYVDELYRSKGRDPNMGKVARQ